MAKARLTTLKEMFRPKVVRGGGALLTTLFVYDEASNQLELPKLGRLLGMSGSLLPWWGWLLVLQAIFVYALFEYVRRLSVTAYAQGLVDAEEFAQLSGRLKRTEERLEGASVVSAVGQRSSDLAGG